jgi:hypothetical protein
MALKVNVQCLVCKAVKADPALRRRIEQSKNFVAGGESLLSIHRDYDGKFLYKSLANHVKKHQAPKKSVLDRRVKQFKNKKALSEIMATDESKQLAVYTGHNEARKEILDKAMKALEAGDVKLTMNAIVSLLGQEQKAEEAAKDRGLKMMEMFNYFASGASGPTTGPKAPIEEAEVS